jgi:drug/metabolite transporter (DMT)-like permease
MMQSKTTQIKATLIGGTAILMWATLALFTTLSGSVPPFQLTSMSFTLAFFIGLGLWWQKGGNIWHHLNLPKQVWVIGVLGLFGYHFFYFIALRNAPAVEASLIAYLWPLLIVLFSTLLPHEELRWFHLVGACVSFVGAALLVTKGEGLSFDSRYGFGYLAAIICALTWSSYSVLSRKFGSVPTDAVGGFCGITAVLALLCHLLFEQTVWPVGSEWLAILCLGLGPIGAAFFTWDYGVKRGNIRALGAFSYAAPLLSTVLLVIFGLAEATWIIGLASLFIVGGAVLAAGDFLRRPNQVQLVTIQASD